MSFAFMYICCETFDTARDPMRAMQCGLHMFSIRRRNSIRPSVGMVISCEDPTPAPHSFGSLNNYLKRSHSRPTNNSCSGAHYLR